MPLTLRQQEIEREIDDLNRRIVLAAMLFILVGAAFGYPLAERIADPVNRLMRATRRIARGDFDARIATTASDELRRLVEAFNMMSSELRRQRDELERTHRLEAWAEMARQVAHEIKNPLTPIQLQRRAPPQGARGPRQAPRARARELRGRDPVAGAAAPADRVGVLQFRLVAHRAPRADALTTWSTRCPAVRRRRERARWRSEVDVPAGPPVLLIDRTLVGRALTNVIDNALHAMPGGGRLRVEAAAPADAGRSNCRSKTPGIGMDDEALQRLFEPYFSTKAVGTGLGLAIARRNIELNGGTIAVTSETGHGTRVTIAFPTESGELRTES